MCDIWFCFYNTKIFINEIELIYFLAKAIPSPTIPPITRAAPPATAIPFILSWSTFFLMYVWKYDGFFLEFVIFDINNIVMVTYS